MFEFTNLPFSQLSELIENSPIELSHVVGFVFIYFALLWLAVIIWVTRDAIHRSHSIFFQVLSILLALIFPVLGVLIYLIIRPSKTTVERYYESLEQEMLMDDLKTKTRETTQASAPAKKTTKRTRSRSTSPKNKTT